MYDTFLVILLSALIYSIIIYNIKRRKFEKNLLNIVKKNTHQWQEFSSNLLNYLGKYDSQENENKTSHPHQALVSKIIENIIANEKPPLEMKLNTLVNNQSTILYSLEETEVMYEIEGETYKKYNISNNIDIPNIFDIKRVS